VGEALFYWVKVMSAARIKWNRHCYHARQRGLNPLTFDQYTKKLADAGITIDQVGRKRDSYHLARFTDKGDYTVESCRFIPHLENLAERYKNGGIESQRQKNTGKTKLNNEGVARQAEKMTGRTAAEYPHLALAAKKRRETILGRTKHTHAGYASAAEKNSCDFCFIDPLGAVHSGRNLTEFCAKNKLLANAMSKLRHGRLKTYKGWRLS
jgi:hypothetical protein